MIDHPEWYAVYTYPRHEKAVTEHLQSQSVEAYFPVLARESRWTDRTVRLHGPVFPSYIFCFIQPCERIKVLRAPGVIRILSYNGRPAPIPAAEIEALKFCLAHGGGFERRPALLAGERVRVRSGILEGLVGQVSRSKGDRYMIVPITLLNQAIAVEVDVHLLEPVEGDKQGDLVRANVA